jgi:hypothetical protein
VRTRTLGGVGGVPGNRAPIPIGFHFGLGCVASIGEHDPRPMLVCRSM